jgi:hypothetical protein
MNRFRPSRSTARRAAVAAAIGFGVLVVFQAVLAAGAPLGEAAWGGTDPDLSTAERIASGVAVVVWMSAAVIVLGRAGFWGGGGGLRTFFGWGTWFFASATAIGAALNFASQSRWENFIWGPIALILAVLCTIVARSPGEGALTRGESAIPGRRAS